jgi:subtilisin family serine protease
MSFKWSLGNGVPSPATVAAYDEFIGSGLIICVAAGNSRENLDNEYAFPGESHPDIIVVGATDAYDYPMWLPFKIATLGTATGTAVDIYAPGTRLPLPSGLSRGTVVDSGTSFASPYVCGLVACMLEGYQRLTSIEQVQAVVQKLIDNSTKDILRFDGYYDGTVVNNRLAYLDPFVEIEEIEGLIKV